MARRVTFSSAHFYSQKQFSVSQNASTFGRCFDSHGHGHDYTLEAFFSGSIQPDTGLLVNLIDVERLLIDVVDQWDHKHLNYVAPRFQADQVPTTENLALLCVEEIQKRLSGDVKVLSAPEAPQWPITLKKVRLYETPSLWVEVEL